jgi:hypothetical protein
MGLSTFIIYGTINAMTNGGFYTNIVVANINEFDFSRTMVMLRQLFIIWPVFLIVSGILIVHTIKNRVGTRSLEPNQERPNPFLLYGVGAYTLGGFITALTVGKVGSDINYFLELMAICSIWISIGLKQIEGHKKPAKWILSGVISAQMIWVFISWFPITKPVITTQQANLPIYDALYQRIYNASSEGIVLSDDYLDMVVLSGQSIYYQPFEYGQLYQAGLWDPSKLAEQIKQQDFPLVVIGGDTLDKECCWPPPLADALRENYQMEVQPDALILTPLE